MASSVSWGLVVGEVLGSGGGGNTKDMGCLKGADGNGTCGGLVVGGWKGSSCVHSPRPNQYPRGEIVSEERKHGVVSGGKKSRWGLLRPVREPIKENRKRRRSRDPREGKVVRRLYNSFVF